MSLKTENVNNHFNFSMLSNWLCVRERRPMTPGRKPPSQCTPSTTCSPSSTLSSSSTITPSLSSRRRGPTFSGRLRFKQNIYIMCKGCNCIRLYFYVIPMTI